MSHSHSWPNVLMIILTSLLRHYYNAQIPFLLRTAVVLRHPQVDMCTNVTGLTELPTTRVINDQVEKGALQHPALIAAGISKTGIKYIPCGTVH